MPQARQASKETVFTLMLLSFFWAFGNPVVNPLLPSIMEHFEITPVEATLLITMYALPGIFIIPILGFLEDRLGRKPILLGSLLLSIVAFFGISTAQSFGVMLAWRALQGLAATPIEALCYTLISDTFDSPEDRVRYLGYSTSILYVGVAVYPLISIAFLALWGWRAAIACPVVVAVILLPLCLRLPMRYHSSQFNTTAYLGNMRRLLTSRRLLSLFGVRMFISCIMFGAFHAYMPFMVTEKLGASLGTPGLLFSCFSAFLALGSVFLAGFVKRGGVRKSGLLACLAMTLGLAGFGFAPSLLLLILPMCLFGFGTGSLSVLMTTQVSHCTSPDTRGSIMSLYSTAFRASQTLAAPIFSFFYLAGSFNLLYAGGVALCLLMTA
ncbi:MFS transporter, partial [Desulfovibrio sp. OttesenSCG-928-C14]|nr:MFS transporter [Desulfovibrio sp. OttesenSCG-928-C14]